MVVFGVMDRVEAFVLDFACRGGVWVGNFLAGDAARLGNLGDWFVELLSFFLDRRKVLVMAEAGLVHVEHESVFLIVTVFE